MVDTGRSLKHAICCTDNMNIFRCLASYKGLDRGLPARLYPAMRGQMDNRRIAAGNADYLTAYKGSHLIHHALFIYIGNFNAGNRAAASNIHRHLAV